MSHRTSRIRKIASVLVFLAVGAVALAAVFLAISLKMPKDAPLARMFRTEADMAGLTRAVEMYQQARGEYPPPGIEGLRQATAFVSGTRGFFPDGPPPDAWGRPYKYVPYSHYASPEWGALRCGDSFCAPDTFQLFSTGADGEAGTRDDIRSWETSDTWRPVYNLINEEFVRQRESV